MPANYPDWVRGVTPRTHPGARPTRIRAVVGVPAIRVSGATYRGCSPFDGVFELVTLTPQQVAGEERFEVYCAWFGVKPLTKYPRLSVRPGSYELLSSYTGSVIDNLSDEPTVASAAAAPVAQQPTDEQSAAEGRELLRLHRTRERNRGLVARKKRSVLSETGRLICEACDFDFAAVYGPRGEWFAECHHTQPISQSVPGRRTSLSELAVVCANCHRMLHRRPWVSVPELQALVRSRRGG